MMSVLPSLCSCHPLRSSPMRGDRRRRIQRWLPALAVSAIALYLVIPSLTRSQQKDNGDTPKKATPSSYDQIQPVLLGLESFQSVMTKDKADKAGVMARQKKLLEE